MINVKFKSKKKVTFSPDSETNVYTEYLIAKLQLVTYSQSGKVVGKWVYVDTNGNEKLVTSIDFSKPDAEIRAIEDQLGPFTVTYLAEADMLRVKQIFPLILDQEYAESIAKDPDNPANFGLQGKDVEHIAQ